MRATTATGLDANMRRLLVAMRDGVPYRLPPSLAFSREGQNPAIVATHLVALARRLERAGMIVPTVVVIDGRETLGGALFTARGAAVAAGLR